MPNVQPPLPSDWEVRPTHPIHHTPYQLAQFWDRGIRQRVEDKTAALQAMRKRQQRKAGSATGLGVGEVPRDLRESARRSSTIRSWVRALEEPVRHYLVGEQARALHPAEPVDDSAAEEMDSEDEEIVFVGRSGAMRELNERRQAGYKRARREVEQETVDSGVVFDSFGEGESAAFKCDSPFDFAVSRRCADRAMQALACPFHLRLLRPCVSLSHSRRPHLSSCIRRAQTSPSTGSSTPHKATSATVGNLLKSPKPRDQEASDSVSWALLLSLSNLDGPPLRLAA